MDFLGDGVLVVADLEVGAVGGEAGAKGAGDARREVAADGRGAVDDDLRALLADELGGGLGIGARFVAGEDGVVDGVDLVDADGEQLLARGRRRRRRGAWRRGGP